MVMVLHTFENTVDSRLGSFDMTAGKLVPVENFYNDPEATKRIECNVLESIIKQLIKCFGLVKYSLAHPRRHYLLIKREGGHT